MQSEPSTQGRPLGDYLGLIRRQWVTLALAVVLGVSLGVGLLMVLPKTYTASSSVLVKAITEPGEAVDARTTGEINMDTESQVVKSLPVAAEVKDTIGSSLTPVALSWRVSVSIPANTTIMSIQYEADSAAEAREGAEAFAQAYLGYRSAAAQDRVDSQLKQLDTEAASTEDRIRTLLAKLPSLEAGSSDLLSTQQELRRLRSRANWVDDQRLPLQTAQTAPGTIIASAQTPSGPASPNRVLVLGSTMAIALLLGLAIAWWRDRHLARIRSAQEVEGELSLDVLGSVRQTRLLTRGPDHLPLQEYRQLVHAIQARVSDADNDVLVAGVGVNSAANEVAHSLATAVSRTGTDVLLVFSDRQTESVFAGDDAIWRGADDERDISLDLTSLESASLVVDGDVQNRALAGYLKSLHRENGQMVILSTPPMETSADAQAVAPYVALAVLVVEVHRTTQEDVARALRQLHQVGVESVCAVVVTSRRRRRDDKRAKAKLEQNGDRAGDGREVKAAPERSRSSDSPPNSDSPNDEEGSEGEDVAPQGSVTIRSST